VPTIVAVGVPVGVDVAIAVGVAERVAVCWGVDDAICVGVNVRDGVAVRVGVVVADCVGVGVAVRVRVDVAVVSGVGVRFDLGAACPGVAHRQTRNTQRMCVGGRSVMAARCYRLLSSCQRHFLTALSSGCASFCRISLLTVGTWPYNAVRGTAQHRRRLRNRQTAEVAG